jgi:activating signal cointegrator complex subunit 1
MQIDEGVDILCPEIKCINGSSYRVLCTPPPTARHPNANRDKESSFTYSDVYEDEPSTCKRSKTDSEFIKEEWKTAELPTPSYFHKYIVGKSGAVKKRLENETGTQINVPRPHENKDFVTVRYRKESSLSSIEVRVESIVSSARKRERPTHFISIPVASNEITENLSKFQDLCGDNIHPHKVQFPSKLHLTIGVLKLFSQQEVQRACDVMQEFSPRIPYILCGKPLRGALKNLEIMNDEPQSVNVLYSELLLLDESDRLQNLADQCLEFFVEKGLMDYEQNRNSKSVKLHCTLINTRWNSSGPRTIDASKMLADNFELHKFGNCVLDKLVINEMTTDRDKKYVAVSTISLV